MVKSGKAEWELKKRYNQFADLNVEMKSKHSSMPFMPPKTYFPLKYNHDIEDRRKKLHTYLQEIVNRVDMRTDPLFRKFIEID